ncbi:hypothetical protein PVPAM_090005500 [Plasmodium vivax]|nr:hypothetical protein PVPAM_090005500 [Plasmodium vivax]
MSSEPQDPGYISFEDYVVLKKQFDGALKNNDNDGFDKVTQRMSDVTHKQYLSSNIFKNLHKVLRNDRAYVGGQGPTYCRYINFWLNTEVRTTDYYKFQQHFNAFQDFSHECAYVKQHNYNNSCKVYIHNIDDDVYIRMKFLYEFYQLCDDLRSTYHLVKDKACKNLSEKNINYNKAIVDYYEEHRDLYNKISPVAKIIEGIINKDPDKCGQSVYFTIPPKVLDEQRKEEERKQAEKIKRELEQAEKLKRELEEAEQKLNREREEFEAQEKRKQMQKAMELQQEVSQLKEPGIVYESEDIEVPEQSTLPKDRVIINPSDRFRISKAAMPERYGFQSEETDYLKEGNGRTEPKTYLGSSGIPSYITEVFGSVDPVPVVGVSGGMGALFLLFRYTPVGTFFRGGRGRAHRIPRSFNGQFLGAFPDINEYNGGYIGYGPMDIPYGAE